MPFTLTGNIFTFTGYFTLTPSIHLSIPTPTSTSECLSPSTKQMFVIICCYYNLGPTPDNNLGRLELLKFGQLLQFKAIFITIQGRIWRYYNSGQFLLQFRANITIWVDNYNSGLYSLIRQFNMFPYTTTIILPFM